MNEGMRKTIAKIKVSRELHIQSQNAQKHVIKHTNNCAQHIPKHCVKCKSETRKKCTTNFDIENQKTTATTQKKKRNTNKTCIQQEFAWQKHAACAQKCTSIVCR